jgi:phosphinothricin acetyltransferase
MVESGLPEVLVRPAHPADWDGVAALLSSASLPLEGAREHFDDFVVASRGETIVGCAGLERYGEVALLRSVAVANDERGRGTGTRLVDRCLADAGASGVSMIVLLTTTAESYFFRAGFESIARDDAPAAVGASIEFRGACPTSATVMRLNLSSAVPAVRPARREDLPAIAAIYNAGIQARSATFETRERRPGDLEHWLDDDRYPVLVAERSGHVVGWIAAFPYRTRDWYAGIAEFSIYVAPAERRRGVGDTLVRRLFRELETRGFWKVLSRIFPENTASRALCRRNGFREVGVYRKHGKLDGVWRDTVIVERLLGEAAADVPGGWDPP